MFIKANPNFTDKKWFYTILPGLQTLNLGAYFNRPLGDLPPGLQSLTLDYYFDQPLGKLPPKLKIINASEYNSDDHF